MMTDPFVALALEINLICVLGVKVKGHGKIPCMEKPYEVYMGYNYRMTQFLAKNGFLPEIADLSSLENKIKKTQHLFYSVDW